MGDEAFAPDTEEVELDVQGGHSVSVRGERGKMGTVVLTNDRILFTQQKFASTAGSGVLAAMVADQLQKRSEQKAGGPHEVLAFSDVTGARLNKRRLLPDLYEFTLADGDICWVSSKLGEQWDPQIRRLVIERLGRAVIDDGDGGWRVE